MTALPGLAPQDDLVLVLAVASAPRYTLQDLKRALSRRRVDQNVVDFLLGSAIMRHPGLSVNVEALVPGTQDYQTAHAAVGNQACRWELRGRMGPRPRSRCQTSQRLRSPKDGDGVVRWDGLSNGKMMPR